MRLFNLFLFTALFFMLACKSGKKSNAVVPIASIAGDLVATSTGRVYYVSMIKLLANPGIYHGKRVMLDGYLNLQFEGNGLYLHKEDYTHGITKNAVWVELNDSISVAAHKVNSRYVTIEATFDANSNGHMDAFGGSLNSVTRVIETGY